MTEQQRQHLSALVDGELSDELIQPTLAALESNPEMRAAWERYHLIAAALRGDSVRPELRAIGPRVMGRLETEPVPIPRRGRQAEPAPARSGSFVGIGLAAAAAFFAVLALPQLLDDGTGPAPIPSPLTAAAPLAQFAIDGPRQRWHVAQPELAHKLDRFLVNHQARSPANGIKGFIPFATVVGYELGR
jgi:sigma-E factor negative regulatory protein RseA